MEDINLFNDDDRCVLIQVKTKQARGERWTLSKPLLIQALYKFYDSRLFSEQPDKVRFVFLTNSTFNPDLEEVKDAIRAGKVEQCVEAEKLREYLDRYAEEKKKSIDPDRFHKVLARTTLTEHLPVGEVENALELMLCAYGQRDWKQAYNSLYSDFSHLSTRVGGGTVTHESVIKVLGPQRVADIRIPLILPAPPVPFVDRDDMRDDLARALHTRRGGVHILVGLGGVGKAALARRVAHDVDDNFPGGIIWLSLEKVSKLDALWEEIANAYCPSSDIDVAVKARTFLNQYRPLLLVIGLWISANSRS